MLCGIAASGDMGDMEIFVDYPVGLWDFISEGTLDKENTQNVHSYNRSVRLQLSPGQTATMYHTWLGEYTQDVESLGFWIYSDSPSIEDVTFQVRIIYEAPRTAIRLGDYASIPTGQWTYVELSLADMNIVEGETIAYTYFKSDQNVTFWLDDIKLNKTLPPPLTTISMNPSIVKSTLSKMNFGMGINARDRAFEEEQSTWTLLENAGISFFNFPGGINADRYDWRTSTSKVDGSVYRVNTEDYLSTASMVGADVMITTNYGSGTPQESADWVNHANVDLGGNVKYWSIGNECYHPGEYDIRPAPYDHDAETYALFCVEAIQLMKAVDPTIKVGVVATYNQYSFPQRVTVTNPRTGEQVNGWSAVLLTTMRDQGVLPDYFDFHLYTMAPGRESDAVAFQMIDRLDFWVAGMRQMLIDYLGETAAAGIKLHLSESNSVWGTIGKMSVSLTNALYLAYQWGAMGVRDVDSHVWWKLHDEYRTSGNYHESLYGWRQHSDWGVASSDWPPGSPYPLDVPYPTFYAMRMIDKFADPGDEIVECNTDNLLLKTFAIKSPSGKLRLMVINISKDQDYTANVDASGYWLPRFVTLHRYGPMEDLSESDYTTQYGYTAPVYGLAPSRSFRAKFNRYSITVIEF